VPSDHLHHLGNALGNMHGEGKLAILGCRPTGRNNSAVQVSICMGETTPERAPAGMLDRRVDQLQRRLEAFRARLLVPAVFELVIVLEPPAPRGVAGGQNTL
jgi:hypothetical protein